MSPTRLHRQSLPTARIASVHCAPPPNGTLSIAAVHVPYHRMCRAPQRILFESRGQFPGHPGATDQAAAGGRFCLRFGGSGSDFAEEPVVRVRAGHAGYESFPLVLPGPLLLSVEDELPVDGV